MAIEQDGGLNILQALEEALIDMRVH